MDNRTKHQLINIEYVFNHGDISDAEDRGFTLNEDQLLLAFKDEIDSYKTVLENAGLESVIIKSVNLKKSKVGNQFVVCFNALENKGDE